MNRLKMPQLRCIFTIATLQDRDIQALFVTYLAQTLGPKVGLERTDHYATQYNLRTGLNFELRASLSEWVLDSKGISPSYFTPVESRVT